MHWILYHNRMGREMWILNDKPTEETEALLCLDWLDT